VSRRHVRRTVVRGLARRRRRDDGQRGHHRPRLDAQLVHPKRAGAPVVGGERDLDGAQAMRSPPLAGPGEGGAARRKTRCWGLVNRGRNRHHQTLAPLASTSFTAARGR
jgi:hypothetical protein